MNRKKKLTIAIAAITVVAATFACASHRHRHAHRAEHAKRFVSARLDDVLDDVDATDKQKTDVHRVKEKLFVEFQTAHDGSRAAKEEVLTQWDSELPDAEKLHALADRRVAAYQKAVHETVDAMVQVHATLKKEQREIISKKLQRHMTH